MKKLLLFAALLLAASTSLAQTQVVTAGGSSGAAGLPLTGGTLSGALAFSGAANPGFAPNQLTTTQRDALGVVPLGTTIYNTTTGRIEAYIGGGTPWTGHVRLIGDTMTGALVLAAGGLVFNGSKLLPLAANVVSQSNLANAQAQRLYNMTDNDLVPANAEWFSADWTGNILNLGTKHLGTGVARDLSINTDSGVLRIQGAGAEYWRFNLAVTGRAFQPGSDVTADFGASASRVRDAYIGRSLQNGASLKTLVESTPTGLVTISVASGAVVGGQIDYTIEANDATDFQSLTGSLYFSAVNKAGTITSTVGAIGTAINAVSIGTLTNGFTTTNQGTTFTVLANAVSSLTQTVLRINYFVRINGSSTVTGL